MSNLVKAYINHLENLARPTDAMELADSAKVLYMHLHPMPFGRNHRFTVTMLKELPKYPKTLVSVVGYMDDRIGPPTRSRVKELISCL